jgi:DNA processing protein
MSALGEQAALVSLLRQGGRPWQVYTELVEQAGSATHVLEQEHLVTQPGVGEEIAAWEVDGCHLTTVLDLDYPDNLRAVHDRPPFVFVAGRLVPSDARSVAVIGARAASEDGLRVASSVAEHLVAEGYTVVSGLAAGIDTAVHQAALTSGGRTVAVIGTGLRRAYPPHNARLQRRIAEDHAVISQFWPNCPPTKQSFPMRNAVMSGLSLATVIVEASHTSGSRIQARLALAHGRPVFVWSTLLGQAWARSLANRPGAYVVDSPGAITRALEALTSSSELVA